MNDTETRLSDYLHAKAGTVPDSAHGPGMEVDGTGTGTRRWAPMALAAAGIAAALLLAVPFLRGLSDHQPATSGTPAATAVSTAAPRIPYTVSVPNTKNPLDTWWGTLHDGKQTIKNPGVKGHVVARLAEGWLVETGYPDPKKSQAAIVGPNGQVRPLGPTGANGPVVSPDGKQIAVVIAPYGAKNSRVVVVNVEDGKEAASVSIPTPGMTTFGWNKDGIWAFQGLAPNTTVSVWQPGSKDVRQVTGLADTGVIPTVVSSTGTIAGLTGKGNGNYCLKAVTLGSGGLDVRREYCFKGAGQATPYVRLSPDGATMVLTTRVIVDVASGKVTKLGLPANVSSDFSWDRAVFEDADNLIVVGEAAGKRAVDKMFRCGVATGECKPIVTAKSNESLTPVQP
jgi:hypothetical protein